MLSRDPITHGRGEGWRPRHYLAAVRADTGQLTVYGRVTKPGRRVAFADGDVRDAAGNVLATSQSSFLVINPTG